MDKEQLKAFQSSNRGPDGSRLAVDGVLGPATRWALAVDDLPRRRRKAIRQAAGYVGARELHGQPNRGSLPDVVLAPLGLVGVPWCAAFVSYVLRSVGFAAADGFKYTASARECLAMFPERIGLPVLGDIAGWVNPGGTGHVGIVIGLRWAPIPAEQRNVGGAQGWLTHAILIEGNSADGVRITARPIGDLQVRALPDELQWPSDVPSAPVIKRQTAGTR